MFSSPSREESVLSLGAGPPTVELEVELEGGDLAAPRRLAGDLDRDLDLDREPDERDLLLDLDLE